MPTKVTMPCKIEALSWFAKNGVARSSSASRHQGLAVTRASGVASAVRDSERLSRSSDSRTLAATADRTR